MKRLAATVVLLLLLFPLAAAGAGESGERWAVVIGIDGYQDLGRLDTPVNDAKAVAGVLVSSGGFRENRVILLTDDAANVHNRPTLATIRKRIENTALLTEPGDTLVVFFSGHGIIRDGKGYIVPLDGDRRNAIALDWVKGILSKSRASNKVFILDACHAGSGAKGVSGIAPSLVAETPGLVMLLSSAAEQVSYPDKKSGRSAFTQYLVEGLEGKADADGDRNVTSLEVFEHIKSRLKDWYVETGRLQTPLMYPAEPDAFALAVIPDLPTLSVTAVDAATGAAIAAEVYLDGRKIGAAPVSGRRLEKGRSYRVEVKGESSEPYAETLVVSRGGVYSVTASLKKITMRVPAGFRASAGTQAEPYTNTGWAKEVVHVKTGIEMVFIPAGEFMMGSPSGESGRKSNEKQHRVMITKAFYLGKYEVTQGQWQKVMGSNPSWFKGDRNPVECLSWNDCRKFVGKAVLRLPTEAEWEYACRAGSNTRFSFSDSDSQLGSYAWYGGNSGSKTHPVGGKRPNGWGLYDMHGNVYEWCT
ncbi:MAG: SUMF1/EgtB/PvdO family nonheme iron enzyme, partial [Planctomycetes bacterium]|nr:SUMF1/EgtB/PvdO family nonheme iron enzyme [Planctomycetota bacterium]